MSRDVLDLRDERVESSTRESALDVVESLGEAELGLGAERVLERAVGEEDEDIGGDGVEATGGDDDGAGLSREVVIPSVCKSCHQRSCSERGARRYGMPRPGKGKQCRLTR